MKSKIFRFMLLLFVFISTVLFISSCDNSSINITTSNTKTQDISLTSNVEDIYYSITFKNYDGSILEAVNVKKDEIPNYSKDTPIRDEDDSYSYVFTGWYPSLTAATKDQSYVAQYKKIDLPTFTVTFDANGGDFDGESMITYTVKKNNKIASPTSPTNKNYDFAGWTTSKNATTLWDFSSDIVNKNITLYAKWEEKEAVIMSVENSTIADDQIYMVVDKDTEYVSLSNRVISSKNSSWKLYRDRLGQTEIPTKICGTLVDGDNNFYIVVTSANGSQTNTYELVIHRSHLVSIKFIDDYTVLKTEYVDSGYEYVIDYIPTFEGCTFESWLLNGYKVTSFILKDYTELEVLKTPNKYKITLDVNGGNALSSKEYEAIYYKYANLPIPTRTGYTFLGWEYNGELLTNETGSTLYTYSKDVNVKAKWKINEYTITLKVNNEKAGSVADGSLYAYSLESDSMVTINAEYGSIVKIVAIINPGYTFNGWFSGNKKVAETASYRFSAVEVVNLEARYVVNVDTSYRVEHYWQNADNDNYTLHETDNLIGTTDTLTKGEVNTYEGFISPEITQVSIKGDGSTVIKLYYTRNSYTVSLSKNIDKAGTITGAGTYKYGKSITIKATTKADYTFNGWYLNGSLYEEDSSFTYTIGTSSIEFEARYTVNKYTITLDNQVAGVTISGITSGNQFDFDSQITLTATNVSSEYTIKWVRSDDVIYFGGNYTFKVPASDITIIITTASSIYTRDRNKIYFGTYPQTKVTASETNGLLSITFDSSTWTSYRYYISSSQSDFMYYKDVDIDNNGTYDYRGVYFTSYRPSYYSNSSSTGNSYQDDNGYTTGTIYWFSYDPIEWDILTESNGKALIIANLILDSQDYYPKLSSSSFSHNGGTGYANNYELSTIRKFLNDNFYNTAFNDLQNSLIETTTVDNSVASTGQSSNSYVCNNTSDKIFLLSYKEAKTYYTNSIARQAKGTDYAKCQGLYVHSGGSYDGSCWLRSPTGSFAYAAYYVGSDGDIYGGDISLTYLGVRPACWIIL